MVRAKNKSELIQFSNVEYEKLLKLITLMPKDKINSNFTFDISKQKQAHWHRDKNVRDVLVHLDAWHNLVISWVKANMNGVDQSFFPSGFNWRTYGQLNEEFYSEGKDLSFETALTNFKTSHDEIMKLAETFSDSELFLKGEYSWVGNTTLGSYFVSATSSHYIWAIKKVKKHLKS